MFRHFPNNPTIPTSGFPVSYTRTRHSPDPENQKHYPEEDLELLRKWKIGYQRHSAQGNQSIATLTQDVLESFANKAYQNSKAELQASRPEDVFGQHLLEQILRVAKIPKVKSQDLQDIRTRLQQLAEAKTTSVPQAHQLQAQHDIFALAGNYAQSNIKVENTKEASKISQRFRNLSALSKDRQRRRNTQPTPSVVQPTKIRKTVRKLGKPVRAILPKNSGV